jgi:putative transposase
MCRSTILRQERLRHKNQMTFYRRNLPHWHPEGASIFLTWRLYGSLPASLKNSTGASSCGTAIPGCALPSEKPSNTARNGCATKDSPGKRFKLLDNVLDKCSTGPHWLKDPRIAGCVVNLIHKGDFVLGYFALHAFVVMPNHIHLLITPKLPIPRILNGLKGATAWAANALLGRKGISPSLLMHLRRDKAALRLCTA